MLTRRPAPRPWDAVALELLLTLACAVQVGLLLWLAVATWDDRGATGVTIGVLVVVALAVGVGWFLWLTGMTGWVLAGASGVAALQVAFLLVLSLAGQLHGIGNTVLVISLAAAVLGAACGIFLPAPSSRRYRPAPRERTDAGGPPSAPRISPSVAAAADRYAKPVVAGAAAVTAAGAKKLSRSASPAPVAEPDAGDAEPAPVLQPRTGTPIRTTGPVDPGPTATGTSGRSVTPARGTPASGSPAVSTSTPAAGTPARGIPSGGASAKPASASGSSTRPPTKSGSPSPDPGAIARQARANIDAELAKPRGSAKVPGSTASAGPAASPGFRTVDPPPPATRVPTSRTDVRFTPSGRTTPPPPPRGQPVGRAGDAQQPGDPGAVLPTVRSVPPPPLPDPGYDADDPGGPG